MAGQRNNVTLYAIGGGIALYILCKRGYIKSGICNIFKFGIPGFTFGGGGGLTISGDTSGNILDILNKIKDAKAAINFSGDAPINTNTSIPKRILTPGTVLRLINNQCGGVRGKAIGYVTGTFINTATNSVFYNYHSYEKLTPPNIPIIDWRCVQPINLEMILND